MTLTNDQQAVVTQFMDFMLDDSKSQMVLSGFAGTGKSFVVNELIAILRKQNKLISILMGKAEVDTNVHITATTNKAARVIADMAGTSPQTIHSFLNITPVKDFKTGQMRLKKAKDYAVHRNRLIIIDESSFIDKDLLRMIHESTLNCKTLFIGDPYQLAPVKESTAPVFSLPCERGVLTQVIRNPGPIERLAGGFREVLQGKDWPTITGNGKEILTVDGPTFQQLIDDEYLRSRRQDNDARILAWSNNKVIQYNDHVRELLGYSQGLQVGEKMISNNFMPNHGISVDQHIQIVDIDVRIKQQDVEGHMVEVAGAAPFFVPLHASDARNMLKYYAREKEWQNYFNIKENWGDLRPLYASTVHKSQGSTYNKVFIDLPNIGRCNIKSDVARLMYVAISRAKDQVILYDSLPAKYGGLD